jgi:elongation factor P
MKSLLCPAATQDDGSSSRHVVVQGGISVMAPSFVKTGDTILVRTEDASFMERARV